MTANPWVQRALLTFIVVLTLSPLILAGTTPYDHSWNDLVEFLLRSWLIEMMASLAGALLISRLKNARKQGAGTLRAELLLARLAFWSALLLSLALPCATVWVWMNAFAMLSS